MQLGANYGSFYNSFDQENQSPAAGHHPQLHSIHASLATKRFLPSSPSSPASSSSGRELFVLQCFQNYYNQNDDDDDEDDHAGNDQVLLHGFQTRKGKKKHNFLFHSSVILLALYKICANPRCATVGYAFYFSMQTIECTNVSELCAFLSVDSNGKCTNVSSAMHWSAQVSVLCFPCAIKIHIPCGK